MAAVRLQRRSQQTIDLDYVEMTDLTFQNTVWLNLTDASGNTLTIQRSAVNQLTAAGWDVSAIPSANIVEDGG